MGANAQTTVPTFTASQVLTADQQNQSARTGVPVFASTVTRDAAFGGTGEKTLAEGQLCYVEGTGFQTYNGTSWITWGTAPEVGGLTFISSTTIGNAVTTVTVSNVFSSTYDNYRVIVSGGASSVSDAGLIVTLGAKVTGYKSVLYYQDYTNGGITVLGNVTTYMHSGRTGTNGHAAVMDFVAPNLAKNTTMIAHGSSPTFNVWAINNTNDTTQYTDFTLDRSAGTLTGGTIKVYGYRN